MWGMRGIQPFCFDRTLPKNCLRKVQVLWMVRNQQPEMWNQKKCHFLGDFGGDLANWAPQRWGLEVGSISSDDTHWKNHPESEPWEIGAPSLWIKEPWRQKTHLGKVSTKKSNWESLTPRLSGWQKKTHPPPKSPRNHPRTPFTHRLTDSFTNPKSTTWNVVPLHHHLSPVVFLFSGWFQPGFPDWHLHNQSSQCLVPHCRFASRWPGQSNF